jgi:HAD superfamily hydrolase (TIGR01509 family)
MRVDAISFDLDGTLIETNDAWHQALDKTMIQLGIQEGVTKQQFYENHIGVDMKKVITSHIKLTEPELEKARNQFIDNFVSSIEHVEIIDNVVEVLDLTKYFSCIVTRDVVSEGKPNPEIVLYACRKLGVEPSSMVFVEDSVSGVIAGKAVGCYVIALTSTTSEDKLRKADANKVISNLLEMKRIIPELKT